MQIHSLVKKIRTSGLSKTGMLILTPNGCHPMSGGKSEGRYVHRIIETHKIAGRHPCCERDRVHDLGVRVVENKTRLRTRVGARGHDKEVFYLTTLSVAEIL